eukprot:scaffold172642_cov79-Cyclotella_meneghiniana.AAC.6
MAVLLGHRCCSNTDGCSNRWMAVQQSAVPGAVCLAGLCSCYSGSMVKGMYECSHWAEFQHIF